MNRGLLQRWPKRTFKERFEEKIYYSIDGCWYWTACLNEWGYGEIAIGNGKKQLANRAAYNIYIGEIPNGLFVCHSCDNPSCVNPNHLFLGDHKDNMQDMFRKGRRSNNHVIGDRNPNAKLRDSDVIEIASLKGIISVSELSKKYRVTSTTIYSIFNRTQWRHILQKESAKALFVK